jgi:hypothetical protein
MNKPQITPGLWHVGTNPGPIVYGYKGEQVTGWNALLDGEENQANYRAITAVPDLLAALERALSVIEDLDYPANSPASYLKEALEKAGYTFT